MDRLKQQTDTPGGTHLDGDEAARLLKRIVFFRIKFCFIFRFRRRIRSTNSCRRRILIKYDES
jgi:hypothetical protein